MDIDIISKIFIIPVLLIACGTMYVMSSLIGIKIVRHRYSSIDGLRAFLAMFVFLHHSAIWYYLPRIHRWGAIPSLLYDHFGPTSVAFFFMITAFLFFSKLINSFSGKLDWTNLYVSRIMRIMPLYAIAVFILALLVLLVSHFTLTESFSLYSLHVLQWLFFMEPNINKIEWTLCINSGVQWSLTYEWVFYCSLALIGSWFFRIKTSPVVIFLSGLFLAIFISIINEYYPFQEWKRMLPFLSGLIAAFLVKNEKVRRYSSSPLFTPILLALLYIVLFKYHNVFEPIPFLATTIIFIAIACGNTIFGMLVANPVLLLGQISYSIYLLHGLTLFTTFYFVIGSDQSGKLPALTYWAIICICSMIVVIVSSITYCFIEKPGMDSVEYIINKMKKFRRIFKPQNHTTNFSR